MGIKTLAWLVHLYTASGAVFGMLALIAAAQNQTRGAFGLLLVAFFIDGTDGILARRYRVAEVLPRFSGAYVDNAVDVLTYIFVPIFIMAWQGLLPHPLWIAVPILAAMYAYGQADMKTEDHYFLGFPSYWNIVALYMYWLRPDPGWAIVMVAVPAALTFIPTRYLYPSRNSRFWRTSWTLGGLWLALLAWLLLQPEPDRRWVWASAYYPIYYFVMSFYVDFQLRFREQPGTRG